MNILVCINDRYVDALIVMLESLLDNNKDAKIYCLYSKLSDDNKNTISQNVNEKGATICFIYADNSVYKDFPVTERLTYECYLILLAHLLLPKDMERILYLDCDLIIDGSLEELYLTDISDVYLAACGQYYKQVDGKWFLPYSRPEKGDCFNSGVLLLNLPLLRRDITIDTYKSAATSYNNIFSLADQGILNIVFYSKTKYLDTMKWNFRISMFEDFIEDGNFQLSYKPVIYHYVLRDYYKVGLATKPWELFFNESEYEYLSFSGIAKREYGDSPIVKMNLFMQQLWWEYAKKSKQYDSLFLKMHSFKEEFFRERVDNQRKEILDYRQLIFNFSKLTKNEDFDDVLDYRYSDLEKYIDNLSSDMAIQTMNTIHKRSLDNLKKKDKIKVAFMVYSSSEWQCEKLYRLMESDERFEPIIFLCGYAHGSESQIKKTYLDVCNYFFNSDRHYEIEYGGYSNNYANKSIENFDLLIYIIPFNGMLNSYYNVYNRKISQLVIYIPYGYYLTAYDKSTYGLSYMDMIIFKVGWLIVKTDKLTLDFDTSQARLKNYNSFLIGLPKMDSFYDCNVRDNLWKTNSKTKKRIIWAPHFNIQKGMNGTFHSNYKWFLKYAQKRREISWIVRPHPRMRRMLVDLGVFKSEEGYDNYLKEWEQLPNARVLEYGDYFDAFSTSDAMILDSISFVAEYQFTGKPMLYLLSDFPRHLSPLGEELHKCLYRCSGNDFIEIEKFIDNISLNEDPMQTERRHFFEDNLNYFRWNKKGASEKLFNYIKGSI